MKHLILSIGFILFILSPHFLKVSEPKISQQAAPEWVVKLPQYAQKKNIADTASEYILNVSEEQLHAEKRSRYIRIVREVVSDEPSEEAAEISVSFDPSWQSLVFHEVILWKNGKPQNKLDIRKFQITEDEQDPKPRKYSNMHTAYFSVKALKKGEKLEFSYTLRGANPAFHGQFFRVLYLQEYKPALVHYTSLISSKKRNIRFKYLNAAEKPVIKAEGDLMRYEWLRRNLPAAHFETHEPEWFSPAPIVQVSDYSDWTQVAKMASNLLVVSDGSAAGLNPLSAKIKSTYRTEEARLREAVRFVQDDIESVWITQGLFRPKICRAEEVLAQGYGDSRDKAVLLTSLLRSIGVESYIALINDDDQTRRDQFLPSFSLFHRAVVKALVRGKDVWIDPMLTDQGGKNAEFYFPGAENALVLDNSNHHLIRIPHTQNGKLVAVEQYRLLNIGPPVQLKVKTTYTLNEADHIRRSFKETPLDTIQKNYLRYYSERYPHIKVKERLNMQDNRKKNEITITEYYKIDQFFIQDSVLKNYRFTFGADLINGKLVDTDPGRKHAITVEYPVDIDNTILVSSAGGWNIDDESSEIKREAFVFRSNHYAEGDLLTLHYQFSYLKPYIPAHQASGYSADVAALKSDYLNYDVIYTPDQVPYYPNYWMLGFSVALVILCLTLSLWLYRRKTSATFSYRDPIPLGGWLIVIILVLLSTTAYSVYEFIHEKYSDLNSWNSFQARKLYSVYKIYLTLSVLKVVFICCFSLFSLFLILKKRDILPRMINIYYASSSVLTVLVFMFSSFLYGQGDLMSEAGYSILTTISCIAYFNNSERVKQTFLVPYPNKRD
ncbi:MAG: DUF3857 domain-containing protein [Arcticibacter sp.]